MKAKVEDACKKDVNRCDDVRGCFHTKNALSATECNRRRSINVSGMH